MHKRPALHFTAMLLLAGLAHGQIPTCPGQGPVLSVTGGRLGDVWSLGLSGVPNAAAIVAMDSTAGPVSTQFGTVCLGLTPGLATLPLTLDATGHFSTGGVLPLVAPWLSGASVFLQAASADPFLPNGFGMTNGWAVTFRPPRLGVFTSGAVNGTGIQSPGYVASIDPVTDVVLSSAPALVGGTYLAAHVPRLGWFAAPKLLGGGVMFVDDVTGATALTINGYPNVGQYAGPYAPLVLSSDGSLLITGYLSLVSGVTLLVHALPSGVLLSTLTIPTTLSPSWILPIVGTSFIYTADTYWLRVLDMAAATLVTQVLLPGTLRPSSPQLVGNLLYLMTTAGMIAVDITTHTIVMGPAPTGQPNANLVAYGPGPAGNALWSLGGDVTNGYTLAAISPQTLAVQSVAPLPGGSPSPQPGMLLSAGGTEWLLEVWNASLAQADLCVVSPATLQASVVLPSIVVGSTTVLRSGTMTKAYVKTGNTTLVPIPTDPIGPPGAPIALQFPGTVLSN